MIDKEFEIRIPTSYDEEVEWLERKSQSKAKPSERCVYPRCEECDKYRGRYCTVPMVVSKQIWLLTEALLVRMEKRLTELETLVTDEILRSKREEPKAPDKELNYTWTDYLGEDR